MMNITAFLLALIISLGYYFYTVRKRRTGLKQQNNIKSQDE
ncbi:Hypothetical protein LUCI_3105 [Lucifera butyrica]|uniref:Uncharacterized protein n=1 Tax=Lucifera butyrica TaxID=1351585 RepID=A0A498RA72_9FIRM|nr:Hypothetical protein LUCI_3105 [Lucifera butyrica]